MQRIGFIGFVTALLVGTLLSGCSKASRPQSDQGSENPAIATTEKPSPRTLSASAPGGVSESTSLSLPAPVLPQSPAESGRQADYDAALLEALSLLGERKHTQALAALEAARAVQDTEQVRREIAKLKGLIEQQAAAERTIQDIQVVLQQDKAEEAARLATAALQQYGSTDAAEQLAKLKRQADALASAPLADNAARRERFRREGEAAVREKNLRAAAIAFEQALQYGDNADLRRQLEDISASLTRYDDNRRQAAEFRRDPSHLEEALAALQEAVKAWDTLQVRQEIDECNLALQKRRDRLSVADFEVRGDVGIPLAGRTVAEELLPAFRSRFDVVERGQLGKVIDELKLEATELAENLEGRREVGRLAKLRFLVLGSVTRLSGITVSARLVEVRSGLVVQTARIVAPTPEELLPLLPQLANVLQMTDVEKIAYEQRLVQQAAVVVQPVVVAPLPPPELPIAAQPPPPPLVVYSLRPPDLSGLRPEDFDRLPSPPPAGQALPSAVVVVAREEPIKHKVVQVAVELGDNLFLRGRFRDAHAQFELALNLSPGREDLRLRIDRCRPQLPPPVVVVATPPPPRPRIAILNFVVSGDPVLLPPGLGAWVAEDIAPYFCPPYEVIERGEVFWYMGRLGMTLRDLLTDPAARRYLGRALNVRSFVFGTVRQGRGIEVTTHLVDAESGFETGAGRIQVLDAQELKLRLSELARLTRLDPLERARQVRETESYQTLLVEARQRSSQGEFAVSLDFYQKALQLRPDSVEVHVLFQRADKRAREAALEEARRREYERQQALAAEIQRRQWELAREAEAARIRAEQEAAARADAPRRVQEQQRERAHEQLLIQGRLALQQNNFQLSIQLFESAVGLKRNDASFRELALARAKAEEAARARAAEEQARREGELRRQREVELAQARAQLEEERRRHEAEERGRREAQEARDQAGYTRLLDQAQRLLAQEKYDAAIDALQTARRLRKTDEVERLVSQALVEQARATAKAKDAKGRADLERQLAEEKTRRERAEDEARRNRELYTQALQAAQQAQATKRYEVAVAKYQEAGKIFRTDAVLNGLREAEEAQTRESARAEAERRKLAEEQKRAAELQRLLSEGQAALQAKQWDNAIATLTAAKKLAPTNVDVLAALSRAEQGRQESLIEARRQQETQQRQATFQKLLEGGKANLAAKQYEAAVLALREAVKLNPTDLAAGAALKEAESARNTAASAARNEAEAKKKAEEYQNRLREGQAALAAGQHEAAIRAFREAQRLVPGDQTSAAFLKDAEKAKNEAAAALAAQAKKRAEELQRTAEVQKALTQGRAALLSRDPDKAGKAFAAAAQLAPNDPAVQQAQQDLRKLQDTLRAEAEARKQDEEQKRRGEFTRLMTQGQVASAGKRFEEAVKAYSEALKQQPGDSTATKALAEARQALAASKVPPSPPAQQPAPPPPAKTQTPAPPVPQSKVEPQPKPPAPPQTPAPMPPQSKPGQQPAPPPLKTETPARPVPPPKGETQPKLPEQKTPPASQPPPQAKPPGQQPPPPPPNPQAEYAKQMQAAAAFEKEQKYAEAIRAYKQALQAVPKDPKATAALRNAEFTQHMAEGRKALAAKRFAEATREFEEALKLVPNNPEAIKALKQAREGRP